MRLRQHSFDIKPNNKFIFLEASLFKRHEFYKKNKTAFSKVFVLGNVPPTVDVSADVIGYFHNAVYLDVPADFSFVDRIKYKFKIAAIPISATVAQADPSIPRLGLAVNTQFNPTFITAAKIILITGITVLPSPCKTPVVT